MFLAKPSVLKCPGGIIMFEETRQNCPYNNTHPQFQGKLFKDPANTVSGYYKWVGSLAAFLFPQEPSRNNTES